MTPNLPFLGGFFEWLILLYQIFEKFSAFVLWNYFPIKKINEKYAYTAKFDKKIMYGWFAISPYHLQFTVQVSFSDIINFKFHIFDNHSPYFQLTDRIYTYWYNLKLTLRISFSKYVDSYFRTAEAVTRGVLLAAGLRPATLLKKRLWHRCFTVNFVKFLRTHFLQHTSGRLVFELI